MSGTVDDLKWEFNIICNIQVVSNMSLHCFGGDRAQQSIHNCTGTTITKVNSTL